MTISFNVDVARFARRHSDRGTNRSFSNDLVPYIITKTTRLWGRLISQRPNWYDKNAVRAAIAVFRSGNNDF